MKKFGLYIGKIIIIFLVCMLSVDIIYTYVYINAKPKNKSQYVLALKNKKIDYVFLGSSRVENHIVTNMIEKETSKKAINLGKQGDQLDDSYIILKLLINNNIKIEKLFMQVDYIFNDQSLSTNVLSETLPYIHNNAIINEHHQKYSSHYYLDYYIPFYRYAEYDYSIGFRNVVSMLANKNKNNFFENGFAPLYGNQKLNAYHLPKEIIPNNKILIAIDALCKKNNIEIIYYCAPFCIETVDSNFMESLKQKIPALYDFSKAIPEEKYYFTCGHLNEKGANLFTQILIDKCIKAKVN